MMMMNRCSNVLFQYDWAYWAKQLRGHWLRINLYESYFAKIPDVRPLLVERNNSIKNKPKTHTQIINPSINKF